MNILPGAEMMSAVRIAARKHIKVAFIDQDIRMTFLNIRDVSTLEKLRLVWFVIKGLAVGWIYQKIKRKPVLDLSKVPHEKLIEQAMTYLRKNFPNIYRALVSERDQYMVNNLKVLSGEFKTIVAVIGAGHKKGMEKLLSTRPRKRRSPQAR